MSNDYFDSTGAPATGSFAASAPMRNQFSLVEAGFNKLPSFSGNTNKVVIVGAAGLTVTVGTLALAGNVAVTGAFNTTIIAGASVSITLPVVSGTLATLAGTETLTNKTLVTPNLGTPSVLVGTNISGTAAALTAGNVTTNANLTGVITSVGNATSITSQTGTGTKFVVDTSPTLVTPNLGTPTALVGTNISGTAAGLTAGNVTTNANLTGVITSVGNATSIASQTGTGTKFVVDTGPTVTGASITAIVSLGIRSSAAAFDLTIASSEAISAGRTLSIVMGNADRTLTFTGNASISGTSSGTNTGDQTTVSGNAGTATALQTARAIYGNNFNGTADLTQVIASTYGGTANAFFTVSGPASSIKTFTFPNASANVLTDNALVTAAQGGTANGFFAVSGPSASTKTFTFPNASATVLTSNTPVTVAQGGTGLATLTANNVMLGNGTSNVAFVAPGTSGNVLTSNGTTWVSGVASGVITYVWANTVTTSGTSVSFTVTGKEFALFHFNGVSVAAGSQEIRIEYSTDSGSTWTTAIQIGANGSLDTTARYGWLDLIGLKTGRIRGMISVMGASANTTNPVASTTPSSAGWHGLNLGVAITTIRISVSGSAFNAGSIDYGVM